MKPLLFLITIVLFSSCNKQEKESVKTKETPKQIILSSDSAEISGEKFRAFYTSDDIFYVLNQKNDTLFSGNDFCQNFDFDDFNEDGYKDIRFHYSGNIPTEDLLLFEPSKKSFRKVENFNKYPEAVKIGETKFYYSYHRSGCADMNWDSDLFYIQDFKAVKIGKISSYDCGNRDARDGIYIYKIQGEKETLFETLPIETLAKYKNQKWDFFPEYWTKNFAEFEKGNPQNTLKKHEKLLFDIEGEYSYKADVVDCKINLTLFYTTNQLKYKLKTNTRELSDNATLQLNEEKNGYYITFENIEWSEYLGAIDEEGNSSEENLSLPQEVEGVLYKNEITIQNAGNAMNYYVKIGECDVKYIHLIRNLK